MAYSQFIVLDIETTGFDPAIDDVIEFSAVKLDSTGSVVSELDLLLSASITPSALVQSLTGITPEMLAGKPALAQVQRDIEAFVGDLPIVGHNINFDVDFLVAKGLHLPGSRLDTLDLAQTTLPAQPGYGLEQLSHRWGFAHQPSHRAMNDVLATVDLFLFLASQVTKLPQELKTSIQKTIEGHSWSWGWLFDQDATKLQTVTTHEQIISEYTDYLAVDIRESKTNTPALIEATSSPINLIETHLPTDVLAQAICYAHASAPALLVVPSGLVRQVRWAQLGEDTGISIRTLNLVEQQMIQIRPDLRAVIEQASEVTPALIRLVIKLSLWESAWGKKADTLFLVSDEYYEWEQKVLTSETPDTFKLEHGDVWVVTADQLAKISNLSDFALATAHPHNLEESFFDTQTRTFSVPYFNAAISSRRDFIHREILPTQPKVADELFKLLSHIAPQLTKLSDLFNAAYLANPPANAFDKDIELSRGQLSSDYDQIMTIVTDDFTQYLAKLTQAGLTHENHQMVRTQRLLDHLQALRHFDPNYKYFLFSEPNRFFLQIIPSQNIFATLQDIFTRTKKVTVISAGLAFGGYFSYWQSLFPSASAKLITGGSRTILQANDTSGENFNDLLSLARRAISDKKDLLIVHGSAYDARVLFDDLHREDHALARSIYSLDTIGLVDKLGAGEAKLGSVVIVPLYWLERAASSLTNFDMIVISKVPFESGNKPIAKLYRGSSSSFSTYTLPKTTLRFKDHLHYLGRYPGPIALMDNRLTDPEKDYGRQITGSLSGWQVISAPFSEIISKL